MALPDFIVIGAAKSGTTSIYALLEEHEDLFMPVIKEPEFFARDDLYEGGLEKYELTYNDASSGQLIGEASTLYTLAPLFPESASRIKAHCPQVRLIYIMRQPVDRAYSFYIQLIKNYQNATQDYTVHRSFEDFILPERHANAAPRDKVLSPLNAHLPDDTELCLVGSDYVAQIETYLAHFASEQMLFLKFEDFVADRKGVMRQITDFLGVAPLPDAIFDKASVTRNVSDKHFAALDEAASLQPLKSRMGEAWGLRRLLPPGLRHWLRQRLIRQSVKTRSHVPPPMTPETRALLEIRFFSQLERLSELTGLSFDDWTAKR